MRNLIAGLCIALMLAGCSTLGTPSGPGGRALDPLHDDVASLVIAFDLPRGLGPAPGSLFTFDAANGGPGEHLRVPLVQADLDQLPGTLPPPAPGRAYYIFGFGENDKLAIRAAQASGLARGVTANSVTIGVVPKLCTSGDIDQSVMTVSVVTAVPGQTGLMRFLNNEPLVDLLQQPGSTQMPPCV